MKKILQESGAGETYQLGEYPKPVTTIDKPEPGKLSLPPEMASLLASMANQVKGQQAAEQQKQQQQHVPSQGGLSLSNGLPSIPPDMQAVVQKVLVSKNLMNFFTNFKHFRNK